MGEGMSEWQPIETAPKDGTEIDVWDKWGFRIPCVRWEVTFLWWAQDDGPCVTDDELSHWMPLPAPPLTTKPE